MKRLLLLSIIILLLASCSPEKAVEQAVNAVAPVSVRVSCADSGGISGRVTGYRITATPQFQQESVSGRLSGQLLDLDPDTMSASLGNMSVGKWLFQVDACAADGELLYRGISQFLVKKGISSMAEISLERQAAKQGRLAVHATSVTVQGPAISIRGRRAGAASWEQLPPAAVTAEQLSERFSRYSCSIDMLAGSWELAVQVRNSSGAAAGTRLMAAEIASDETTTVACDFTQPGSGGVIEVPPGETVTFPELAVRAVVPADEACTGFCLLDGSEPVACPWTNSTSEAAVLLPVSSPVSGLFEMEGLSAGPREGVTGAIRNIAIPGSVSSIGARTFLGGSLESIVLPSGLVSIGELAFSGCPLASLSVPASVSEIGADAFAVSSGPGGMLSIDRLCGSIEGSPWGFPGTVRWSSCKVTFDPGGTPGSPASVPVAWKTVSTSGTYGDLPLPSRPGYAFQGWKAPDGTAAGKDTPVREFSDHALLGTWAAASAEVSFDYAGSSGPVESRTVAYDSPYGTLPVPAERPGYSFSGWFSDEALARKVTAESIMRSLGPVTLHAGWAPREYTLSFDASPGSCPTQAKAVTHGQPYGDLPVPNALSGYDFLSWTVGGEAISPDSPAMITADSAALASWAPRVFSVSFDAQGGTACAPASIAYMSRYGSLPASSREGYLFAGWSKDGSVPVGEDDLMDVPSDTELIALWTPREYTVSFQPSGGSACSPVSVRFAGRYGALPSPSRKGMTFAGWYLDQDLETAVSAMSRVTAAADHALWARWSANSYQCTFSAPGCALAEGSRAVVFGEPYGELPVPSKGGWTFAGWRLGTVEGEEVSAETPVSSAEAHTLCALMAANAYTASFDAAGGAWSDSSEERRIAQTFASPWKMPPEPSRPGYSKDPGWIVGEACLTSRDAYAYTSDIKASARWTACSYSVRFDPRGGRLSAAAATVTFDSPYGELPVPVRDGYSFSGWTLSEDGAGRTVAKDSPVATASDHTLYASWKPMEYSVALDPHGGTVSPQSAKAVYQETYGELPEPSRTGYDFLGWHTAADGGSLVSPGTRVTILHDITLHALWKLRTYAVTYSGAGADSGSAPDPQVKTYSLPLELDSNSGALSRTGYSLLGWCESADGLGALHALGSEYSANAPLALHASWKARAYSVGLDAGGGSVDPATYAAVYDSMYEGIPAPERDGYSFMGWNSAPDGSGFTADASARVSTAADHTLWAQWVPRTYTVTLDPQGGTVSASSLKATFDSPYGELPVPARSGCSFDGWRLCGGTSWLAGITASDTVRTASDHMLRARWLAELSYDGNGEDSGTVPETAIRWVGSDDPLPGNTGGLARDGMAFCGWGRSAASDSCDPVDAASLGLDGNTVLHAVWAHSVALDACGGSVAEASIPASPGSRWDRRLPEGTVTGDSGLPEPVRDGYAFTGWYASADPGMQYESARIEGGSTVPQDVPAALFAGWAEESFTVTLDPQGGTVADGLVVVSYGSQYGELPEPEREGGVFKGWYTGIGGTGARVIASTEVLFTGDHSLYALWSFEFPVAQGGTAGFGELAWLTGIPEGQILTGFCEKGSASSVTVAFPFVNSSQQAVTLVPRLEPESRYGSRAGGVFVLDASSEARYLAFGQGVSDVSCSGNASVRGICLPQGMDAVGAGCVSGCSALETCSIPASVQSMDPAAFAGCVSLKEARFQAPSLRLDMEKAPWQGPPGLAVTSGNGSGS